LCLILLNLSLLVATFIVATALLVAMVMVLLIGVVCGFILIHCANLLSLGFKLTKVIIFKYKKFYAKNYFLCIVAQ